MSTAPKKRWSRRVTEKSDALDLDRGVFTWKNPKQGGVMTIAIEPQLQRLFSCLGPA